MDPFGESAPDEPAEFDPESLGPETPDVEPDLEESLEAVDEVDEDLFQAFWGAAIFLNVAIAAVAIGLMLVYFRGEWSRGGAALAVGGIAAVFTARFYLGYHNDGDDETNPNGGERT